MPRIMPKPIQSKMYRLMLILLVTFAVPSLFISCTRSQEAVNNLYFKDLSVHFLNQDDGQVKLADYKGSPVVVNFWASWCIPCRQEMPFLEQSWREHRDEGVKFIGINVMDDREGALEYLKSLDVTFPNLYDPTGSIANSFNVSALPVTLFVDKEGQIVNKNFGGFLGEQGEAVFKTNLAEIIQ